MTTHSQEDVEKCVICGMPQPGGNKTLHYEDCAFHDPNTCMVCIEERLMEGEEWSDWIERMKTADNSPVRQIMNHGVGLEAALTIIMLGKVHNELVEFNEKIHSIDPPTEDGEGWKED